MTFDNSIKIKFPALEQWGKWYVRWFGSMVASFKSRYGLEIAEDAVSQASGFRKGYPNSSPEVNGGFLPRKERWRICPSSISSSIIKR